METIIQAWNQGLDYVEHDGKLYGMFSDGVWVLNGTHCNIETDKRFWLMMPDTAWGSNS